MERSKEPRRPTYEESVEAAKPVKAMAELARTLDVDYLTKCVVEMKSQHSHRLSMLVLDPSPFTAAERSELEAAKIKGLELMIALAENQELILVKTMQLMEAKGQENQLSKMFGL